MLDEQVYQSIYAAVEQILRNNAQQLGGQFCQEFLSAYNPRNGQQGYNNAQFLFNFVSQEARRINGSNMVTGNDQLFQIVGVFIQDVAQKYANQMRAQQQQNSNFGGGFGGGGGFGSSGGFGSGGGFSRPSGFFNNSSNQQGPGSHLIETPTATTPSPTQGTTAQTEAPKPQEIVVRENYKPNPLDEVQDSSANFSAVKAKPLWADEKPKDNRIVVIKRDDMKSHHFAINRFGAYHQLILDDQMDVVRDFFDIVPDQTLGAPFLFRILYNHLDVIDIPTEAFVTIRKDCINAVAEAEKTESPLLLHKKIGTILETLPTGQWKALTNYLLHHINRALYLNARLPSGANGWSIASSIKLNAFDDVNELLSSSFNHPLTTHPDGRRTLEAIVAGVLWNVLVINTAPLFDGDSIPTHALQSSPAFPFSMENVYPNKFAIPMDNEENSKTFMENLKTHELSKRTYLLSRRSVVITNMLGKTILPFIGNKASIIANPLASILTPCAVPYGSIKPESYEGETQIEPLVLDDYPSQQLEHYLEDPAAYIGEEQDRLFRVAPTKFPVDQTIFAVQFGTSPKDYLMALDIFTTIDNSLNSSQMILAKKTIPTIKTV